MSTSPQGGTYKPPVVHLRAGAEDALKKPSIVGGKPVAYTGPKIGCVGILKDRRQHHIE